MDILLLGKHGQLGWELHRALQSLGRVVALDYPEIDLSHASTIIPTIQAIRPQIIINATAYTAVDKAESEPDLAFAINAAAPGILAEEAAKLGAAFIHFSTDYVFDGEKGAVYLETDPANPLNVYGQSKLAGELAITQVDTASLILRTSWVYSLYRDSFVTKVLSWSRQKPSLSIVADQIGNPTWARMLAEITALLLASAGPHTASWIRERRGIYHLAGSGFTSRLEWAQEILKNDPKSQEQVTREIRAGFTRDFPTPARRPLYSALDCAKFDNTFNLNLPAWQTALKLAMHTQ